MIKKTSYIFYKVLFLFDFIFNKITKRSILVWFKDFIQSDYYNDYYTSINILNTEVSFFIPNQITKWTVDTFYTKEIISTALHGSLKRLHTDYIYLYQLHWPERNTKISIESILLILKKFIDQGKIRYIGISNETSWGLLKFLEFSKLYDLPRVASMQNSYNLLNRSSYHLLRLIL